MTIKFEWDQAFAMRHVAEKCHVPTNYFENPVMECAYKIWKSQQVAKEDDRRVEINKQTKRNFKKIMHNIR